MLDAHDSKGLRAMSPADDRPKVGFDAITAAMLAVLAVLVAIDLVSELGGPDRASPLHLVVESTMIGVSILAAARLAIRIRALVQEAHTLRTHAGELSADLDASRAEAIRWQGEAHDLISGLGAAIDQQLERWGLSPAEKEIALLLLKGLSHKEIAQVREVSEATVRQQAGAIYRKSGLGGRNDLAAFFLEDLLGPRAR